MKREPDQSASGNRCPVCGYPDLAEPSRLPDGDPSFEICVCCGTEFGVTDWDRTHDDLREVWIAGGLNWWSKTVFPPDGWDPTKQLEAIAPDGNHA